MSAPVQIRAGDARRAYLEQHVFELLIAVLSVLAALAFFLEPGALERSPIGHALHPFDTAWNVLYLTGGALVAAGLLAPNHRLEVAGLIFLSSAILSVTAATIAVRGLAGAGTVAIYVAVALACAIRVNVIRRLEAALDEVDTEVEHRFERRQGDR